MRRSVRHAVDAPGDTCQSTAVARLWPGRPCGDSRQFAAPRRCDGEVVSLGQANTGMGMQNSSVRGSSEMEHKRGSIYWEEMALIIRDRREVL